jgi:aspartyl-tRNA(Asn)/glutamyl-tRNA(Gln) amidotransferase subunit A
VTHPTEQTPELAWLDATAQADLVRRGEVSAPELVEAAIARIEKLNPQLDAVVRTRFDAAREEAAGDLPDGPFRGVPLLLKDLGATVAGEPTSFGIGPMASVDMPVTSFLAEQFRAAGFVVLGRTTVPEFGTTVTSEPKSFPPARNPWNPEHITGGSSSGSGTAIGARMVRMAMGSDTGGSIRGPAAWCGTVGIKATYGRVSRRGVFPLSWTLDHIGPLSRSVEDSAITLQVLAGHDPRDPASADVPVPDYRADLEKGVGGLRIGVPRAFFATAPAITQEVLAGIDRTAAQLRAAGATVEDIELPDYALFSAVGRVIMMAEAFAIHEADMRSRLLDYGEITAGRFVLGAAVTAADFIHALRARRELTDAVNAALSRYDALLTLSALATAPRFDQPTDALSSASPIQTIPFNVTGHPAMSVPTGLGASGLPIGVQIVGRAFDEPMVFRIGRAVEKLSGWESVTLPGS